MQKTEIIDRLKRHLQTAVLLEFSTLAPYLCAWWSIYGTSEYALYTKNFILSIVQEEMLHLSMACNMLNAIGGSPVLNDPALLPSFPCSLPGHSKTVNPFIVHLDKCCPDAVETFLKIELPEPLSDDKISHDGWCTIGEFYDEIKSLLKSELLDDADFDYGKQVSNQYNPAKGILYEVRSRADALNALDEIIDQGEGYQGNMFDKEHELTHYRKFEAIHDLMQMKTWHFGNEVYNMTADPDERFFSGEAKKIDEQFNTIWTNLLNELTSAFNSETPSPDQAINLMMQLKTPAIALMQIPLLGKPGNAGPTFRYIQK